MMKTITILTCCMLATGCATHTLHFSSEPPGATVSLRKGRRWIPGGKTPCEVEMKYPYVNDKALVSFPTGTQQEIDLHPSLHRGRMYTGYSLVTVGNIGLIAGTFGSGSWPLLLGSSGSLGLGWNTLDRSYSYTNATFHIIEEGQPTTESTLSSDGAPSDER